jgi:hypothetical protein
MLEIFLGTVYNISTFNKYLHLIVQKIIGWSLVVEILSYLVEIVLYNISTRRSSNQALFDKISNSGDGGGSGDIFSNVVV